MKKYGKIIIIVVGILVILALLILIYFKTTFISKNEVKDIISANMNVNSGDLYFEDIDFEFDKGVYEVEVYYQNRDYEYKIDAKEGKVIYTDFKYFTNQNNTNNTNNTNDFNNSNNNGNGNGNNSGSTNNQNNLSGVEPSITLDEAKNIAVTNAGVDINSVKFTREELDHDNHTLVYELEFFYNNIEYDYEINATSGDIISYDKDSIYD